MFWDFVNAFVSFRFLLVVALLAVGLSLEFPLVLVVLLCACLVYALYRIVADLRRNGPKLPS